MVYLIERENIGNLLQERNLFDLHGKNIPKMLILMYRKLHLYYTRVSLEGGTFYDSNIITGGFERVISVLVDLLNTDKIV
jgi:hypothetical protein